MGVRFKLHPSQLWEGWPESIIHLSMPQSSYSSYGGAWGLWKVFENCLKDRQSQGNHPRVCAISDHIICIVSVWFRCMLHRPWDLMNTSLWRITFVHISKKSKQNFSLRDLFALSSIIHMHVYFCTWGKVPVKAREEHQLPGTGVLRLSAEPPSSVGKASRKT